MLLAITNQERIYRKKHGIVVILTSMKDGISRLIIVGAILLCNIQLFSQSKEVELPEAYSKYFKDFGVSGSIAVYDRDNDKIVYFDTARTHRRFSPASTFKIFNSLVALETGVAADTSFTLEWDGVNRGKYAPWHRANSLNSAFKYSVVWYYQELARRVGAEEMQRLISLNKYGNEDINDKIDEFWLSDSGGKLRISQVEQIAFLRKLFNDSLAFSKRSQQLVKDIPSVCKNRNVFSRRALVRLVCRMDRSWKQRLLFCNAS